MFIRCLQNNSTITSMIISLISMFIIAILNIDIVGFMNSIPIDAINKFATYIINNKLSYTFNSSVLIIILNIVVYWIIVSVPKLEIYIRNKSMKSDITMLYSVDSELHYLTPYLTASFHMNYGSGKWLWIINWLDGIRVKITYPKWVDLNLDNRHWNVNGYIKECNENQEKYIIIKLSKALHKNRIENFSGELFVSLQAISNLNNYDEEFIGISVQSDSDIKWKQVVMNVIIKALFNINYKKHKLSMHIN